ncbi:MAG: HAD family hydrolase [bacterium]|nr:HAD family hydrolase [bacterium]
MIKAILTDAMFTIFTPRNGLNRYHLYQKMILENLGREVDLKQLEKTYDEKRKFWEARLPARHNDKWSIIAREIILALLPDVTATEAERVGQIISTEFLTNPDFYEVLEDTKKFLDQTKQRGLKMIIASNQDIDKLTRLVSDFGLAGHFHGIHASTEIGFEKPDPRFFAAVLKHEGLLAEECVMTGNNPDNDVDGAKGLGITGILYDLNGKYPGFTGYKVKRLTEIFDLKLFA